MLPRPSIVCRVARPILSPIVAAPGDVLAVWPGHPTHALTVLSSDGLTVRRACPRPEGLLYGDLLHWFLDAAVLMPEADQRAFLVRPA